MRRRGAESRSNSASSRLQRSSAATHVSWASPCAISSRTPSSTSKVKTKRYLIGGGLAVGAVVLATKIPGIATWLEAQWPSGSGPDEAAREKGWFRVVFIGQGGGQTVYAEIRGDEDPGYGMTRKWVGESALALAQDRDRLPERFGVLTPVAAMAEALEARMPATGTVLRTISASDL